MCGGSVLPGPTALPQKLHPQTRAAQKTPDTTGAHPNFWQENSPTDVLVSLILCNNPIRKGKKNLDMEDSMLHHVCMADCYDFWVINSTGPRTPNQANANYDHGRLRKPCSGLVSFLPLLGIRTPASQDNGIWKSTYD